MRLNRRGIFGLFAGAAAAPAVPGLPEGGPSIWTLTPKFNEIVAGTLSDRSSQLAANVAANNALLAKLQAKGIYRPSIATFVSGDGAVSPIDYYPDEDEVGW